MVASAAAPAGCRRAPNFAAPIYGAPFGAMPYSGKTAAHFLAWAQDDALALEAVTKFYDSVKIGGPNPKLTFSAPAAMASACENRVLSSDHWIDEFYYWLKRRDSPSPQQNKLIGLRLKTNRGASPASLGSRGLKIFGSRRPQQDIADNYEQRNMG
jgi:hypothetical protein